MRQSTKKLYALIRSPWILPIIGLAAAVRFYDATKSAIWHDEGYSLMLSSRNLGGIWAGTARDVHPPLYYVLLHGWRNLFGDSIFTVRTLSVLAGIGAVVLGVWLTRLIATRRAAILAGVFLALFPIMVRYSQEVRMYGLLSVWLLGAAIAVVYWVQKPQRNVYLVWYALLMAAGFYTHYFTALALMAFWLYLLLLWNPKTKKLTHQLILRPNWWAANIAIIVLYLPWIPNLIHQFTRGQGVSWIPHVTIYTLPSVVWDFLTFTDGRRLPILLYLLVPLLLVAGVLYLLRKDHGQYKFSWLISIYTFVPIVLIYIVSIKKPLFVDRYLVFAAAGIPILIALALDRLDRQYKAVAMAAVAVVVIVEIIGIRQVYSQATHQMNVIADVVNKNYKTGDAIVSGELYTYFDFSYYNHTGLTAQLYTPNNPDGIINHPNGYGESGLLYQNAAQIYLDSYRDLQPASGRVWLIGKPGQKSYYTQVPYYWELIMDRTDADSEVRLYLTQ